MSSLCIEHLHLSYPSSSSSQPPPSTSQPLSWFKGLFRPFSSSSSSSPASSSSHMALQDVCLQVERGEIIALLGPNGCGKTSLLRAIAGFETPHQGKITLESQVVFAAQTTHITHLPASQRQVGMVFQNLALFPHLHVSDNITFGLNTLPTDVRQQRLQHLLDMFQLHPHAHSYCFELSGGLQQRVALARALALKPQILLLDEPFSSLDSKIMISVMTEIKELLKRLGITTILVTHSQSQAFTMANRLAIMLSGHIHQVGSPKHVFQQPVSYEVAAFLGERNFIQGTVHDHSHIQCALGPIPWDQVMDCRKYPHPSVVVAVPRDALEMSPEGIAVEIIQETFRGHSLSVRARICDHPQEVIDFALAADHTWTPHHRCLRLKTHSFCVYNLPETS